MHYNAKNTQWRGKITTIAKWTSPAIHLALLQSNSWQWLLLGNNLAMQYMCNPTIWQCNICAIQQYGNAWSWVTICNRTQRNFQPVGGIASSHHAFLISGCWPTITVGGASSWGWMHFFSYLWLTHLHRQTFLFISDQLQLLQAPKCLLSGITM